MENAQDFQKIAIIRADPGIVIGMVDQAGSRLSGVRRAVRNRAIVLGFCLAAVVVVGAHWSHETQARVGLALFLALTACVYLGALLAQHTSTLTAAAEFTVAGLVFVCAWLGLTFGAIWLAVGYALHGAWDWLHHSGKIRTRVAAWFPPACAVFDFVVAACALFVA